VDDCKLKNIGLVLGCNSVVQSLPSMREALGSIPALKKKRQKKRKTSPQKRKI
jgi:hypothetical protein